MNTSFERSKEKSTVEWYTPKYIIDALGGRFDLDPASSQTALAMNNSAMKIYTKEINGLENEWFGNVFLNPPYTNPDIGLFMKKLAEHGNGIALVYNRADSKWFQDYVFDQADAILFLRKRIKFFKKDGTPGNNPGTGSILIAYGAENVQKLEQCGLDGKLVYLKQQNHGN
jgi:hypothetical protein